MRAKNVDEIDTRFPSLLVNVVRIFLVRANVFQEKAKTYYFPKISKKILSKEVARKTILQVMSVRFNFLLFTFKCHVNM